MDPGTPQPPRRAATSRLPELLPRDPIRLPALESALDPRRDPAHHRADVVRAPGDRLADHLPHLRLRKLRRQVLAQDLRLLLLLLRELGPPAGPHLFGRLAPALDRARED